MDTSEYIAMHRMTVNVYMKQVRDIRKLGSEIDVCTSSVVLGAYVRG